MAEYLFTFDMGTTGVKAGVLDRSGRLIGTAYQEYNVRFPAPGWVEQSIEEMHQAQCEASKEVLDKTEINPGDIAAVSVSCQRATFVPLDKDLLPLTRFIGWQDKRSIEQCEKMKTSIGAERYYQIAGLPLEPTASVSKILWLKEHTPEIFAKTRLFASTQNVHLHHLGVDDAPCDLPDAAYMGLLDVDKLEWSTELLTELGIPAEKMPPLVPSGTLVGKVSREASHAMGLKEGTPVVTAGGDLQCSGLGMGVAHQGLVSVGIGTGGGVLIGVDKPLRHPDLGLNCLPHAVEGMWEMEGICLASGAAYKWFRDVLGKEEKLAATGLDIDAYEILNAQAAAAPPGSNGLIILPSLIGAGAPNWYPKARGVVIGLNLSTDKKTMIRAMLEGICFEIRWIIEAAEKLGTKIDEVRIWGGAAKSPLWNQIAADVYGVPAAKTEISDAGLVGAAICAGVGIKMFENAKEGSQSMVRISQRFESNPENRAMYDEMFGIFKDTYTSLTESGVFERISSL